MSINSILSTAASGLRTAQTGLRVVSDNVANVNTSGYVRKVMDQTAVVSDGVGQGVDVGRIRLVADRFLQAASQGAAARASEAGVSADFLDAAQSLFGDPAGDAAFFDRLDRLFVALESAAGDPTSPVARGQAVAAVSTFFEETARIADGLQTLRGEADQRLASGAERANALLKDIEALNDAISRATVSGQGAADAENAQAVLVDELSTLLDVRAAPRPNGGVSLRTTSGLLLAGAGAATLTFSASGGRAAETAYGELTLTPPGGDPRPFLDHVSGGALKGLLLSRDRELPAVAEQLAEFAAQTADALNRAHNAASAAPPPSRLTGRNTGLDAATAVAGFTGRTAIVLADAGGRVTRKVDIDFSAGTLSVDGGPASGFTPADFVAALDAALEPAGDAGFSGGVLTLDARSGGVAVADTTASKSGRGLSHVFGLNDLVRSSSPAVYDTGLRTGDPHGFDGSITLRLSGEGGRLRDVTVSPPVGGSMADLLTALNSPSSGVGLYGGFSLDGRGRLTFTASTSPPAQLAVAADATSRGPGGPSLSGLFGIGSAARAGRADGFSVRSDIAADARRLSLAQVDGAAAVGAVALAAGDARGGRILADAGDHSTAFAGGRDFGATTQSLSQYAASFGGMLGARAADAESRQASAVAVAAEADARRLSVEGVNLDEELIQLTTYQQAYNASARLIQAAKELYDVLLQLT